MAAAEHSQIELGYPQSAVCFPPILLGAEDVRIVDKMTTMCFQYLKHKNTLCQHGSPFALRQADRFCLIRWSQFEKGLFRKCKKSFEKVTCWDLDTFDWPFREKLSANYIKPIVANKTLRKAKPPYLCKNQKKTPLKLPSVYIWLYTDLNNFSWKVSYSSFQSHKPWQ